MAEFLGPEWRQFFYPYTEIMFPLTDFESTGYPSTIQSSHSALPLEASLEMLGIPSVEDIPSQRTPSYHRQGRQPQQQQTQRGHAHTGGIRVDMSEQSNLYIIQAELPGVRKQDIHLDLDDNQRLLVIEADVVPMILHVLSKCPVHASTSSGSSSEASIRNVELHFSGEAASVTKDIPMQHRSIEESSAAPSSASSGPSSASEAQSSNPFVGQSSNSLGSQSSYPSGAQSSFPLGAQSGVMPGVRYEQSKQSIESDKSKDIKQTSESEKPKESKQTSQSSDSSKSGQSMAHANRPPSTQEVISHMKERSHGHLRRLIRLPRNTDTNKVCTSYQDGLLTIIFEKKAEAQTRRTLQVN